MTYNNFACFYRRTGKLTTSLKYLEHALKIEYDYLNSLRSHNEYSASLLVDNPADTHLNICAILSQLNNHKLALYHAMSALALIQAEVYDRILIERSYKPMDRVKLLVAGEATTTGGPNGLKPLQDREVVMAIAYHNIGVENEFLAQVIYIYIYIYI